ncbi:MFS transporter [Gluconacetobacter sacchari]|uniref:MFS transporter n=1 Tax=Gluconacetobacter sacchari TaxID=92759 RepID=UPI0039B55940
MFSKNQQIRIVSACFGGWTMDAFDFFITVFALRGIADSFHVGLTAITWALSLPLATRVFGALLVGRLADRLGRRPLLLGNMIAFTLIEIGTCTAPSLTVFFLCRAAFGLVMGGEWGVCTSFAMESVSPRLRGVVSGLLQSGYSVGYLLAAMLYGAGYERLGWRGMYLVGICVAACIVVLRAALPRAPVPARAAGRQRAGLGAFAADMRGYWPRLLFAVIFMVAASTFSHGTQDLYPTMLRLERGMSVHQVALIATIYNVGAILGCLFGGSLSQVIGRRRQVVFATAAALLLLPFWAWASGFGATLATAFVMQFLVQCTYGVMPAYLNEMAPAGIRSTFAGFVYQVGIFLTATNVTLQSWLAGRFGGRYSLALALTVAIGLTLFFLLSLRGPETRQNLDMAEAADDAPRSDHAGRASPSPRPDGLSTSGLV